MKNCERLNKLAESFGQPSARRALMDEFGDSKNMYIGKNADGESITISIYPDQIVLTTYQDNG